MPLEPIRTEGAEEKTSIQKDKSSGWYTIASNTGNRAIARFGLRDTNGGDHQSIVFYASHHFGKGNEITTILSGKYNGSPYSKIRIKEGSTYEGALLQVYIDTDNNTLQANILGDNFQKYGWRIEEFVPDGNNISGVDQPLSNVAAEINIDNILRGGIATTGNVYANGSKLGSGTPSGGIIMWSGAISEIPDGWTLCDGSNGAPDLRNRFIVGAGDTYNIEDTGGQKEVQLTEDEMPSHAHELALYYLSTGDKSEDGWGNMQDHTDEGRYGYGTDVYDTPQIRNTGGDQPHENRPPYYAMAYIMKL